jgi:hypothetical protein
MKMGEKRKKAQIQSQLFIYLLAIIVIGFLLVFGTRAIMSLFSTVDEIDLLKFKTDIESNAKRIAPNYGKWEKFSFDVPREIEKVCFVEHEGVDITAKQGAGLCDDMHSDYHFLMCNSWKDALSANVFTVPFQSLQGGSIYLGEVQINGPDDYLCVPVVDGKLDLKLVGRGNSLLIESLAN